jgi:hypothetical protein
MTLYFNGCSFTYGTELQDPKKHAWPALVAKSLGSVYVNDGIPGGANDRIIYKVLSNVEKYDYFFIAWTFYSRFTEYNPADNFEISFTPMLNLDASLHHSDDLKKNYKKYKTYGEMYYKHWFNELFEFKKWLHQILLLQSFFEKHNKKYLMLNASKNNLNLWLQPDPKTFIDSVRHLLVFFDCISDDQLIDEHNEIQKLSAMIDKSTFIRWNQWCIVDLFGKYPSGPHGHILEDGHKEVAEIVLEHYNKVK